MDKKTESCSFGISNRKWVPCKLLYSFIYGGAAAFNPFLIPLYTAIGLTLSQISIVEFLVIAIATISRPLIASIADKTRRRGLILGISLLVFMIPSALLLAVYEYHASSTHQSHRELSQMNVNDNKENYGDNRKMFALVITLRALGAIGFGPSFSLPDAVVYDMLGLSHAGFWGQQRLFGTIAWGTIAGITGLLLDHFHSFSIALSIFAILTTATAVLSFVGLPKPLDKKKVKRIPYINALKVVIRNPEFITVSIVSVLSGIFLGTTEVLVATLLSELKAPKLLYGLCQITYCVFEIPVLFFAGTIIFHIGEMTVFIVMFLAFSIRFLGYSFLTEHYVWLILLVESLHILCYGLFFAAASMAMASVAPKGTSSTLQGILGTCYLGIGMGIGKLTGPNIYSAIGSSATFRIFSGMAAGCFAIFLFLYLLFLKKVLKNSSIAHQVTSLNLGAKNAEFNQGDVVQVNMQNDNSNQIERYKGPFVIRVALDSKWFLLYAPELGIFLHTVRENLQHWPIPGPIVKGNEYGSGRKNGLKQTSSTLESTV